MPSAFVRYLLILNVAISIYYKISIAILKQRVILVRNEVIFDVILTLSSLLSFNTP